MSAPPPPYGTPGYPGQVGPTVPGQPYPDKGAQGYAAPMGQPMPGQPMPGQQMPGQPMPGQPMPGQPGPAGQYPATVAGAPPAYGPGVVPQTVIVQPIGTVIAQQYRDSPVRTICPFCNADIMTSLYYDSGTFTWLVAGVVCILGCTAGCCLIPFCVDGCKDAVHNCPNCQQQISRWSRL